MNETTLIIHPGYSIGQEINYQKYGDYNNYIKNLKRLIQNKKDNLIIILEENPKNNPEFIKKLKTQTWLSENNSGILKKDYMQEPKNKEIKKVNIAGEWVWWMNEACVSEIAKTLINKGIEIRLIPDCVYPTKPPSKNEYELDQIMFGMNDAEIQNSYEFIKKLYEN